MPGWNECGIYDEKCRNKTCDHPTNTSNQDKCQSAGPHGMGKYDCKCPVISSKGVQCRTMLSQRPCGMHVCTRPECKSGKPQTPSVRPPFPGSKSSDMPSLSRLTVAHVRALMGAVERDSQQHERMPEALREAYRVLCEADLDARGYML